MLLAASAIGGYGILGGCGSDVDKMLAANGVEAWVVSPPAITPEVFPRPPRGGRPCGQVKNAVRMLDAIKNRVW